MEKPAIDYASFVRGFLAATDGTDGMVDPPDDGLDPVAFAEGVAAWAALSRTGCPATYRELSTQDGGRFTGTLDTELAGITTELPLAGTLDLARKPC
ncbi:hypothetical protein ACFS2C_25390 [Prauserella oleivorans]|uniref:Uncharacterized protein n=1 Tax=Prauserella oleivorans TaxID=1478153 RepID=A0ABW5WI20_9PSEU